MLPHSRLVAPFTLILTLACAGPVAAQSQKDLPPPTTKQLLLMMNTPISIVNLKEVITLKDGLDFLQEKLEAQGKNLVVRVNQNAFLSALPGKVDILQTEVVMRSKQKSVTVAQYLTAMVRQLPIRSAFAVRNGYVEVYPNDPNIAD